MYKLTRLDGRHEQSNTFRSRQEVDNHLDLVAEWHLHRITASGSVVEVYHSPDSGYTYVIQEVN